MGGELRHRAIRDSAKVTQEFSGRAGDGIQHCLPVASLWKGCGRGLGWEAASLVWGLWGDQLPRTVGSSRGFWINPGCATAALLKCRNEIKGEVSAQSSSPGRTENRTQ